MFVFACVLLLQAEGSAAAAPQISHVMDKPIKFTPAPLTQDELLLLGDDQPALRAVAVGAAADAEGMELPYPPCAVRRGAVHMCNARQGGFCLKMQSAKQRGSTQLLGCAMGALPCCWLVRHAGIELVSNGFVATKMPSSSCKTLTYATCWRNTTVLHTLYSCTDHTCTVAPCSCVVVGPYCYISGPNHPEARVQAHRGPNPHAARQLPRGGCCWC